MGCRPSAKNIYLISKNPIRHLGLNCIIRIRGKRILKENLCSLLDKRMNICLNVHIKNESAGGETDDKKTEEGFY